MLGRLLFLNSRRDSVFKKKQKKIKKSTKPKQPKTKDFVIFFHNHWKEANTAARELLLKATGLSSSPCCSSLEDQQKEWSWELPRVYFLSQDLSLPVSSMCLYSEHRFKDQSAKKKENKGDFLSPDCCRLPWPTLALKPIPGIAPAWFSLHLQVLVNKNFLKQRQLLYLPCVWILRISLDSLLSSLQTSRTARSQRRLQKQFKKLFSNQHWLFFLDSFNNTASKQVPSFELPGGLL